MWVQFDGAARKSYLPDWCTFHKNIMPASQTLQRPGYRMWGGSASGWIAHETGNERPGTDAQNHNLYMANGAKDQYGNDQALGYHFGVDGGRLNGSKEPQVWQNLPIDEVSWQAACGACGGNYDRVSCEQAVNSDGDEARARDLHEWLAASVLETLGLPGTPDVDDMHYDWNNVYAGGPNDPNRHRCPNHMAFRDGYWPTFQTNVAAKWAQIKQFRIDAEGAPVPPKPTPTYAAAVLPEWFSRQDAAEHPTDQKFRDATAYVCKRNYKALRGTVRRSEPTSSAPRSGPNVIEGEKVFGIRLWVDPATNATWILEESGHWLLASKFSPRVRIDPRSV